MTVSIINVFLTIQWKCHPFSCNKFPGLFYILLKNRLFHQHHTTSGWLGIRHTNTIKFSLTFDFFYLHSAYSLPFATIYHKKTKNDLLWESWGSWVGVLPTSLTPYPQPQDESSTTYLAGLWKLEILHKVPSTGPKTQLLLLLFSASRKKKNT